MIAIDAIQGHRDIEGLDIGETLAGVAGTVGGFQFDQVGRGDLGGYRLDAQFNVHALAVFGVAGGQRAGALGVIECHLEDGNPVGVCQRGAVVRAHAADGSSEINNCFRYGITVAAFEGNRDGQRIGCRQLIVGFAGCIGCRNGDNRIQSILAGIAQKSAAANASAASAAGR